MKQQELKASCLAISAALLMSVPAAADGYDPYAKLAIGYILDKPDRLRLPERSPVQLYGDNSDMSYTLETGIKVQGYRIGLAYSDLVQQEYEARHRPQVLQVFMDSYTDFRYFDLRIGTGIKVYEDSKLCLDDRCSESYSQSREGGAILNRFTARIGLFKQFDCVTVGLEHHSQWLQGKPFSDEWEFHKTELTLAYEW